MEVTHRLRRALRAALLTLSYLALALLLCMTGALVLFLSRPEILINTENLARFTPQIHGLLDPVVKLRWEQPSLSLSDLSFTQKKLTLKAQRLCFHSEPTQGCAENFSITAVVDFASWPPKLHKIPEFHAQNGVLTIASQPTASGGKASSPGTTPATNVDWLSDLTWGEVDLTFTQITIPELGFKASASLKHRPEKPAEIRVKSDDFELSSLLDISPLNTTHPLLNFKVTLTGSVSSRLLGLSPHLDRLSTQNCKLALAPSLPPLLPDFEARNLPGTWLRVDCPVSTSTIKTKIRNFPALGFQKSARLHLRADLHFRESDGPLPDFSKNTRAYLQAELLPFSVTSKHPENPGALAHSHGSVSAEIDGIPTQGASQWKGTAHTELSVELESFERLVTLLENSNAEIPAPFRVLRGKINATLQSDTRLGETPIFPVKLEADLRSETQKAKILATARLTPDSLDADVLLKELTLQLPRLRLEENVQYLSDDRFENPTQRAQRDTVATARTSLKKSQDTKFKYRVRIRTPPDHPATLLTNLSSKGGGSPGNLPVPVSLDLAITDDQPTQGSLKIAAFPIEIFKRRARVERMNITFEKEPTIDGSLKVEYADYTLRVLLLNELDRPTVKLISDPPLPEDELYSVLLFGVPPEDLDEEQGESVGGVQAAIADRAINLASLYLLASTPIQSVGYDAHLGVFTAKLKLGPGTSLNLASATRETAAKVGIRKRLGRYWTIVTELHGSRLEEGSNVTTFLEWRHRY